MSIDPASIQALTQMMGNMSKDNTKQSTKNLKESTDKLSMQETAAAIGDINQILDKIKGIVESPFMAGLNVWYAMLVSETAGANAQATAEIIKLVLDNQSWKQFADILNAALKSITLVTIELQIMNASMYKLLDPLKQLDKYGFDNIIAFLDKMIDALKATQGQTPTFPGGPQDWHFPGTTQGGVNGGTSTMRLNR